jgi:CRP/FNR family transcriptional regulator
MESSQPAAQVLLKILSCELTELTERARSLLLPQTVGARLAKLLLEWTRKQEADESGLVRINKSFTHEEMAQMICSSRETVTRLLASLSRREIIQVTTESIVIRKYAALETAAHGF